MVRRVGAGRWVSERLIGMGKEWAMLGPVEGVGGCAVVVLDSCFGVVGLLACLFRGQGCGSGSFVFYYCTCIGKF
jgi:hypothetical protein